MKQPELGKKVQKIRNQKGLTQQELSDSCNVDVRTIQRIESGEVVPRWTTVRILAAALECEESLFKEKKLSHEDLKNRNLLLFSAIMGFIYFLNLIVYNAQVLGVQIVLRPGIYLMTSTIHLISGILFFYGFYILGKNTRNVVLKITSIVTMILISIFVLADVAGITTTYNFIQHIKNLAVILMGINGVLFGIGLLNVKSRFALIHKIAGIIQIVTALMFIVPAPSIQLIGIWLSFPFVLLLIGILFLEFGNYQFTFSSDGER